MKHRSSKGSVPAVHPTAVRMGRKIADLSRGGDEAVTDVDLLTDFSAADIAMHAEAARDVARRLTGKRAA